MLYTRLTLVANYLANYSLFSLNAAGTVTAGVAQYTPPVRVESE